MFCLQMVMIIMMPILITLFFLSATQNYDEELPHEFFLTARQKTKIKNDFAKSMSADIKLNEAKLPKWI